VLIRALPEFAQCTAICSAGSSLHECTCTAVRHASNMRFLRSNIAKCNALPPMRDMPGEVTAELRRKTEDSLNIRIIRPGDAARLGQHSVGGDIAVWAASIRSNQHDKEDTGLSPRPRLPGPRPTARAKPVPPHLIPAPRTMIM
jgi:hypothetical protein